MTILDEIVEYKRSEELPRRKQRLSLEVIRVQATEVPPPRDFVASLRRDRNVAVIAELKAQIEDLRGQIDKKDQQIENLQIQLQEASQCHDTVVMQMSKMLEYERQPFWRRWFKQKSLPPPGDVMDMEPDTDKES